MRKILATACVTAFFLAAANAQTSDTSSSQGSGEAERTAGGPLKGIDVKAGKTGEAARTDSGPLKGIDVRAGKEEGAERSAGAPLKGVDVKSGRQADPGCASGQPSADEGQSCPAPNVAESHVGQ